MSDETNDLAGEGECRRADRKNLNLALTFLFVGVALGAFAALLLAPKTLKEIRRKIRRQYEDAREVVEDLGDQASDLLNKGSEWVDQGKSKSARLRKLFQR
jgi:gas vesicle protein